MSWNGETITKDAYKYWTSGGTRGSLMGPSTNTPAPSTPAPTPTTPAPGASGGAISTPQTVFPQYSSAAWSGLPQSGMLGQPQAPQQPGQPQMGMFGNMDWNALLQDFWRRRYGG